MPFNVQPRLEIINRRDVQNLRWQLIPVRIYSDAKSNLATSGVTPILLNLENLNAGGEGETVFNEKIKGRVVFCAYGSHQILLWSEGK